MTGKVFFRKRHRYVDGAGVPRYLLMAAEGLNLDVYGQHLRMSELKAIAEATGAELVVSSQQPATTFHSDSDSCSGPPRTLENLSEPSLVTAKAIARLTWADEEGRKHTLAGDANVLARRLRTLRSEAKLMLLNGEVIGECTRLKVAGDSRVARWIWSYKSPSRPKYKLGDTPCPNCLKSDHKRCRKHLKDGTCCSCWCPVATDYRYELLISNKRR